MLESNYNARLAADLIGGALEEQTGCDLRRLADVIDLLIAVRLTHA